MSIDMVGRLKRNNDVQTHTHKHTNTTPTHTHTHTHAHTHLMKVQQAGMEGLHQHRSLYHPAHLLSAVALGLLESPQRPTRSSDSAAAGVGWRGLR
jgi:hypothetical protein